MIGDKLSSFMKSFPISENCDTNKISAKFEGGMLLVRQPKLIVPADKEADKITPSETAQRRTPAEEPPAPKIDQQVRPEKTMPSDHQDKKTGVKDSAERPDQTKEEKPTKEKEKTTETTREKNDERKYPQEKSDEAVTDQKASVRRKSSNQTEDD